ncbi:MAG: hypothetical protein C5B51_08095 [Terriglobia bacterium]|nr:MAG: hypothetical protein C5B51_08095 [Terriglobia bacterium]
MVYYPGYMSYDSVAQLRAARHGVTNNSNPAMMSYVWRILDQIIPGPGGMLILNLSLFWFSLAAIAHTVSSSNALRAAIVLGSGLLPPIFGLIGTIWKDIGMQGFFLAAVAFSLLAHRYAKLVFLVVSSIALWFGCSYRHNGIAAAVPLVAMNVLIAVPLLQTRYPGLAGRLASRSAQRLAVILGTLVFSILLYGTTELANNVGVADGELWQFMVIHDLAGISVDQGVNLLPAETGGGSLSVDQLRGIYVGAHMASLFDPPTRPILGAADQTSTVALTQMEDSRRLFRAWVRAVLHHPLSYLRHRSLIAKKLLVFHAGRPWGAFQIGIDANEFHITFPESALNKKITEWLWWAVRDTWFYSAWIYHAALVLFVILCFWVPFRYAVFIGLIATSGMLYALSNLLLAGSGDFRYNMWAIGCCCLCVALGVSGLDPRLDSLKNAV